ncbi:5584_t:CDS:10 [Diversispora eburnea]|uniref:Ubiquitin carboxyl-terminal hydrolase n=1 Tax=Diversispora eburnea TaxID=1213867 RepID=A0A9N8VD77_9GLOM|nr:5584_t:CDS:10 [Diversispora eburnea]
MPANSERGSSAYTNRKICPHINRFSKKDSPTVKIDSSAFKKQIANSTLHCEICDTRIPKIWVCLHPKCRSVVCSSHSSRSHMLTHFESLHREDKKDSCHSIFINPRTLTIWCYSCSIELNPFNKDEALSYEVRNYLKIIVRWLVGLKNLGNTCYASAALQCLSNTPALTNFFNYCDAYIPRGNRRSKYKLAEYFRDFIKAMWSGISPIYAPVQLIATNISYDSYIDDDRSAYGCGASSSSVSLSKDHFYDLPIQIDKKFKQKSLEKNDGFVWSSVKGFLGFSGRTLRLQDCIAAFCATENLTGEDKYKCEKCNTLSDIQKTLRITRFRYDSYFSSKIGTHVEFPLEDLDMSPYCKEGLPASDANGKYNLYGLIHHRGGLGGGHYVAYAKNPIDGNWYEFDDTYITKKSEEDISRLEAYALFYSRTSPEKYEERKEILARISNDPGIITNYDFICKHGGINLKNYHKLRDMVVEIPFSAYKNLADKYGTDGSPSFFASDYGTPGCSSRKEAHDVNILDSNSINHGEYWCLVSSVWLQNWHNFKSGGPLPGAIDNNTFLLKNGRPRPGMKKGIDYRGVNIKVWTYFQDTYGGGPAVFRATIDLYSPPIYLGFKNGLH